MLVTFRLAALLCASALALSACGQADSDSASDFRGEQKAVAQAVEDLQSASRKRDADKVCTEVLAPVLVSRIKAASKDTCQVGVKDVLDDVDAWELDVEKVAIDGTTATATVTSDTGKQDRTDTLTLVKVGRTWKISELGSAAS